MPSRHRLARTFLLPALLASASSGLFGAAASRLPSGPVAFACEAGVSFTVAYQGDRARITTSQGSWVLGRSPSSVGRKFQSERATFIHDDEMAALNGLPGGPFRRCRAGGPMLTGGRP